MTLRPWRENFIARNRWIQRKIIYRSYFGIQRWFRESAPRGAPDKDNLGQAPYTLPTCACQGLFWAKSFDSLNKSMLA